MKRKSNKTIISFGLNHKDNIHMVKDRITDKFIKTINPLEDDNNNYEIKMKLFLIKNTNISISNLNAKQINYFYVANILSNQKMLKEAAQFYCNIAVYYMKKHKNALEKKYAKDGHHTWPSPDYSKLPPDLRNKSYLATPISGHIFSNLTNRGYIQMVATATWDYTLGWFTDTSSVYFGLKICLPQMQELAIKQGCYDKNEIGYILRGMMQLRDIHKMEKYRPDSLMKQRLNDKTFKDRIKGKGVQESRGWASRYSPIKATQQKITKLYTMEDHPKKQHDFIQGMSGSTLDYCNWLLSIKDKVKINQKSINNITIARLFQVNYAAWHTVAPDGQAHSQHESINIMCEILFGAQLKAPLFMPITREKDINLISSLHLTNKKVFTLESKE